MLRATLRFVLEIFSRGVQVGQLSLVAELAIHLADGDALRASLACMGASGLKPCLICNNILSKGSDIARRRPGFFEIDEIGIANFDMHSDQTIWELFDKIQAMPPSPARNRYESLAGSGDGRSKGKRRSGDIIARWVSLPQLHSHPLARSDNIACRPSRQPNLSDNIARVAISLQVCMWGRILSLPTFRCALLSGRFRVCISIGCTLTCREGS